VIIKITAAGTLLLVLAGQFGDLASAQDGSQPLEPIASPADPGQFGDCDSAATRVDDCGLVSCCPCPRGYGYAEVLFLERDNGSFDQPLILQQQKGIPDRTVLSTSDLDFDFEPAMRILLGRRLHDGWAIEGSYLGLFDADASAYLAAPPQDEDDDPIALKLPGGLGTLNVFRDMDRIWVDYSSVMHSAELNLVRCQERCTTCGHGKGDGTSKAACGVSRGFPCRTWEWFAGFRYLNLSERLRLYGERVQDETGNDTPGLEYGVYDIRSSNNLCGAQLGGRLRGWGERWGWEATGKAGLFGNGAHQEQYVLDWDDGLFPARERVSAAGGRVAFVGELNLTGVYRLTDVWNLRAGYNLIWIGGVALAPDQLDFSGVPSAGDQLRNDGQVFLHGVSGGLEARW
jgi:hypothetical protein